MRSYNLPHHSGIKMKSTHFRRLLFLAIAVLLCQGCTYKILFWERNIWQEFDGVFVVEEPDNMDLYATLLPNPFNVPEVPMVGIFTADYFDTEHWPITLTKYLTPYLESALFLRCEFEDTIGWYCAYMAVTTEAALIGGRRMGYPKILANSILFEQTEEGWIGSTMHNSEEHIRLDFDQESLNGLAGMSTIHKEFIQGNPVSDLTFTQILLKPPAIGPEVAIGNASPPPLVRRESGWVTIKLGGPVAGLIESGTVAPGLYQHFSLGPERDPSGTAIALTLLILLLSGCIVLFVWLGKRIKKRKHPAN